MTKRGPKPGKRGPQKGSIREWIMSFEVGDHGWLEVNPENTNHNRPPIRLDSELQNFGKFQWHKYCAVPQTLKRLEPVYIWRVERIA